MRYLLQIHNSLGLKSIMGFDPKDDCLPTGELVDSPERVREYCDQVFKKSDVMDEDDWTYVSYVSNREAGRRIREVYGRGFGKDGK